MVKRFSLKLVIKASESIAAKVAMLKNGCVQVKNDC